MPGSELIRDVGEADGLNRNPETRELTCSVLDDEMNFVHVVVFLAEDEVPGKVGHQTDVARQAELQSRADLTQRSQVMVVNRINREVFALTSSFNQTV